ncbi:MAG: diguanylate cyclase [Anaerolineales bacterium]|nr:diguanylate cyclase [Anaerolineales bacterium]
MDIKWIIFAVILIANAVTAFVIALLLSRRPAKPGIRSMTLTLCALGIWSFSYAMITVSPTLETKHFWLKVENIGIITAPVLWFFFTLKYTRMDKWLTGKPIMLLFWVIPVISLCFIFSERWFHLYYTSTQAAVESGGPLLISRGPMYWLALAQSYLLELVGTGVLIWRFIQSRLVYRRQMLYLIGAVTIPFSINIIYQLNPRLLPFLSVPVDLTPLFFNVTAILLVASIFGLSLFDLVPIARDTVMEHIPEMVFVVDAHDRVVDANLMAQKWLGKSINEISGQDPVEVFRGWPQLLNRFFFTEFSREEIEIPGTPPHMLELIVTPIYNRLNTLEGRVIVARDITESKALENKLKEVNLSLQKQLAENETLRTRLQEQAIRDPLTGAFNRRYFSEALDQESARSSREKAPYSILILDIDRFKQFNDTYGHKCGDIVLQSLANFLNENTRQGDIVCRYGGEEFVILMTDVTSEAAYKRAERFRKQFEEMVIEYDGKKLQCTFSAGIASYPVHADVGETLLSFADQALYRSKTEGRNRVSVYVRENHYQTSGN